MDSNIKEYKEMQEGENIISITGIGEDGRAVGMASISLKFRGWMLGWCSYFPSNQGLALVSKNGRGWKARLIEEAKAGLQAAVR